MYAKNLTLHKGVDNKIQFQFINQEQKPVDITGKELTCRIISHDGTVELLRTALVPILPVTGIAELQITEAEIMNIDAQPGAYSIEIPDGEFNVPVFVDADSGARGVIRIVDSIRPKHVPSNTLTINSHNEAIHFAPVTYTTGVYVTNGEPLQTIQIYPTEYTGDIQVQGTVLTDTDWYNIGNPITLDTDSNTQFFTIEGYHPRIRISFNNSTNGDIAKVVIR